MAMTPQQLTPQERELVEIVREFANVLRREMAREMRAYRDEQRQIWREMWRDILAELRQSTHTLESETHELESTLAQIRGESLTSSQPCEQTNNKQGKLKP